MVHHASHASDATATSTQVTSRKLRPRRHQPPHRPGTKTTTNAGMKPKTCWNLLEQNVNTFLKQSAPVFDTVADGH